MRREGLEPRHIRKLRRSPTPAADIKARFSCEPGCFSGVNPEDLPPEQGTLWKVIYTTGTTSGRPAPIYVAAHDHFAYLYVCATRQELIGLNSADRLASCSRLPPSRWGLMRGSRRNSGSGSVDFLYPDRPFRYIFSRSPHFRRGRRSDRTPSRDCLMGNRRFVRRVRCARRNAARISRRFGWS